MCQRLIAAALLTTGISSCGRGDDGCSADYVALTITDPAGNTPVPRQITFAWGEAQVLTAYCPADASNTPEMVCTETGWQIRKAPATAEIVVKARGFHTLHWQGGLQYRHAPEQDGRCHNDIRRAVVSLTAASLPAFEQNADYATGFLPEDGYARLQQMAVTSNTAAGSVQTAKFFIENIHGDPAVYVQNTRLHPLHYDFVRSVLGRPVSLADYEAQTYHGPDRTQMAGSIVIYPDRAVASSALNGTAVSPVTIEFFPSDDLTPTLALLAHQLLEERLQFIPLHGEQLRLFYMPATTSHETALSAELLSFRQWSALWLDRSEVYGSVQIQLLNPGRGCGLLHQLTPEALAQTPLSYKDLVLLTRLPNEIPLVGGTITEELQTPLAHVNVAARSRGTPNLALLGASQDPRVAPWVGQLVCLDVATTDFELSPISQSEAEAFWSGLGPAEPSVPVADLSTSGLTPFSELVFADSIRVGAKAANLAELRRALDDIVPDGFAIPFFYYEQFIQTAQVTPALCADAQTDCLEEGRPLEICAEAAAFCTTSGLESVTVATYIDRLLADPDFQLDTVLREAELDSLTYLFHHIPVDPMFGQLLDNQVFSLLGSQRARLRSSTNAEDLPNFSGAGLYRSISGQVGTDDPPSSRVRKVWASVWRFAAFEERAFWRIDHTATKMGVAVHRSFPDEDANGVLVTQSISNPAVSGMYVNVQLGEWSVTNPENGALPEILTIIPDATGVEVVRDRYSSLSPGEPVMTEAEIFALFQAATVAQAHFSALYGENPLTFALELEFKLIPPDRKLVIKQARPFFSP